MTQETKPAKNALRALLETKSPLILDGAMGTQIFGKGLVSGNAPEEWNITHPDVIRDIHQAYADAGSDIILTNSFGGTRFRLKLHKFDGRVLEFNRAAASLARSVADAADHTVLVAGSMGPTGELLEPMGTMTPKAAEDAFAEQAQGLAEGGADLIWIETMSDLDEVAAAVSGARRGCDLPVTATLSFDTAGRSMMGVTGTMAAERLVPLGIEALGANCGNNLADTEAALAQMRAVDADVILISKANAGIPIWKGDGFEYNGSPDVMGAHAHRVHVGGAALIGACCGSSPEHIRLIADVLSGAVPVPEVDLPAGAYRSAETPERSARAGRGRRRRSE